jgi:hypothetical protein
MSTLELPSSSVAARPVQLLTEDILINGGHVGPRLLLGDFNEWTRGPRVESCLPRHFDAPICGLHLGRTRTYPGILPLMHLDHIYFDARPPLVWWRTPPKSDRSHRLGSSADRRRFPAARTLIRPPDPVPPAGALRLSGDDGPLTDLVSAAPHRAA